MLKNRSGGQSFNLSPAQMKAIAKAQQIQAVSDFWGSYYAGQDAAAKKRKIGGIAGAWTGDVAMQASGAAYKKKGTEGLKTLYDPADFEGRAAAAAGAEAQDLENLALLGATKAQQRMYKKSLGMTAPYRELGERSLAELTGSLQPGSKLGTMRSQLGAQQMPKALSKFDPAVIDELMGRYNTAIGVQEDTARVNRARDLMSLGMGQAAQGVGMAGQQGQGLSGLYLQGAQQQGMLARQEAAARREGQMGALYGGSRMLGNYLGGAYG
jgi:hypothetical protein